MGAGQQFLQVLLALRCQRVQVGAAQSGRRFGDATQIGRRIDGVAEHKRAVGFQHDALGRQFGGGALRLAGIGIEQQRADADQQAGVNERACFFQAA